MSPGAGLVQSRDGCVEAAETAGGSIHAQPGGQHVDVEVRPARRGEVALEVLRTAYDQPISVSSPPMNRPTDRMIRSSYVLLLFGHPPLGTAGTFECR